jgi:hypothetical protein
MSEQVEGQYGDYQGLRVGDRVKITAYAEVTEVGTNYAEVEIEGNGDELSVGMDWDIKVVESYE